MAIVLALALALVGVVVGMVEMDRMVAGRVFVGAARFVGSNNESVLFDAIERTNKVSNICGLNIWLKLDGKVGRRGSGRSEIKLYMKEGDN